MIDRWKAHVDFLLTVTELLFLSLTVDALQRKTCQNPLLFGGVGHFELRFQGKGVVPGEYFFLVSKKLDIFLLSDSANCTVLRAVILKQYRRMTDRQTDGRNCYS